MRRLAAVIALLVLVTARAGAQSETGTGDYSVGGVVIAPHFNFSNDFEVLLMREGDVLVERVRVRAQQLFMFRVLVPASYYLDVEIPGFKKVHELVDFQSGGKEVSLSITLEPAEVNAEEVAAAKPLNLVGEEVVVPANEVPPSSDELKKLREAEKKLQEGDVRGAQSRLETLVRRSPKFYDAHRALGTAYQRGRRYADAEKEYQLAGDLRPHSSAPLILLGSLYLEQVDTTGEPARGAAAASRLGYARTVLLRAVQLSPEAAFGHYLLGVTHYRLGRYEESEKSLIRALELEPRFAQVRLALANIYVQTQDWQKALTHIDAYLLENPYASDRGSILATRKRIEVVAEDVGTAAGVLAPR